MFRAWTSRKSSRILQNVREFFSFSSLSRSFPPSIIFLYPIHFSMKIYVNDFVVFRKNVMEIT